jgi:hypothetical protein
VSKKRIVDIAAIVIVLVFSILIFLLPQISQDMIKELCSLDAIMKTTKCDMGRFLFYAIPAVSSMWIVIRASGKLLEFL